jgi:hypothetical protein
MAKRPIHLAKVYYKIANNKTTNKKWLSRLDEIFVTTENLVELNSDKDILSRLANRCNKKIADISIDIKAIELISKHGFTNDRF